MAVDVGHALGYVVLTQQHPTVPGVQHAVQGATFAPVAYSERVIEQFRTAHPIVFVLFHAI
jgi:hypothetical protein